jgi:CHAD domain-containing protein
MAARRSRDAAGSARRVLGQDLAHARTLAAGRRRLDDDAIHAVRKDLKHARAALRLLRGAVSEDAYRRENAALRDAARPLAAARDARALLETAGALLASSDMKPHREALARLRARLRREHDQRLRDLKAATDRVERPLEQSGQRIERWRMLHDGSGLLLDGLRRIYRKGRRALRATLREGSDAALHESRKQAKYLRSALEIFDASHPKQAKRAARRADKVTKKLGDDHDLALLARAVRPHGAEASLRDALERRRGKLQRKAIKEAGRLYSRKATKFAARFS